MSSAHVYIIANTEGDFVKVGYTGDPHDRLEKLQQSTWQPLELVYCFPFESRRVAYMVEQRAHSALFRYGIERLKGEWFACSAEVAEKIVRKVIRKAWDDCKHEGKDTELVGATPLDAIFI
jgi:predicted GIY-YIG superfamily endonuclease